MLYTDIRSVRVKDMVKILHGQHTGRTGVVTSVLWSNLEGTEKIGVTFDWPISCRTPDGRLVCTEHAVFELAQVESLEEPVETCADREPLL